MMIGAIRRESVRRAIGAAMMAVLVMSPQPAPVEANGFRILSQSASALGQSDAFTAQADDPSAVYYNPAGMTQLKGLQVMAGGLIIGGGTTFTQAATGLKTRSDLGGTVATPPPLYGYATWNLAGVGEKLNLRPLERVTLGFGVLSPFGLKVQWPATTTAPLNTALTSVAVELVDFKPTVAVKVLPDLSVGVGADIYTYLNMYGQGHAEIQFNSSGGPGLPPAGTPIEINGRNTTAGFNLSLRYTPCGDPEKPRCAFGFVYRSQSGMPLNGHFLAGGSFVSNTQINFVIPQVFTWGLAAWPIRDNEREWKVEVDIDKTDWHSFRNTNVTLTTLGTTIPVNRNWSDSITIMLGTEYKMVNPGFLPHWDVAFRGGYYFSQNAIPSATFDPAVPDANSHSVSVGMGFLCNDRGHFAGIIPCGEYAKAIGMDFAYQALVYETRHIGNNVPAFTSPLVTNGTYNTLLHVASVNLRVKF